MRYRYLIFLFLAGLFINLCACKKSDGNWTVASVTGKWNLLSDSTYAGVGVDNHAVNYTGQTGDYFDFETGGKLYTKEGQALDTLNYSIVADTSIIISAFGLAGAEVSRIKTHTANKLTIIASDKGSPGGTFGRKLYLSR